MKKRIFLLTALVLCLLFMTACTKDEAVTPSATVPAATIPAQDNPITTAVPEPTSPLATTTPESTQAAG